MRRGRPKAPLTLTDDERETLRWSAGRAVRRPRRLSRSGPALCWRALAAAITAHDLGTRRSALPADGLQHARSRRCSITSRRPSTRCSMPRPPHLGREGHARTPVRSQDRLEANQPRWAMGSAQDVLPRQG